MPEISGVPLDTAIPDNLTIPQFFLDSHHPRRPVRTDAPWLIENETGRHIGFEEIRARTFGLANGLSLRYGIKEEEVDQSAVLIFSPNHVDYAPAIWATHRLGGIVSTANPAYTVGELLYQIQVVKATLIIAHSSSLQTALDAAIAAGIPSDRIIAFGESSCQPTVESIIQFGLRNEPAFVERRLKKGEAKTKVALLCFSSGTTGKPKAVTISHYAPIVNIIQMAQQIKVNENYAPWKDQRFRLGDIAAGVLPFYHIYALVVGIHLMTFCGTGSTPNSATLQGQQTYNHPAVKNYDLSGIRYLICGAAPLSAELVHQLTKIMPNAQIGQGYGLTESCTSISLYPTDQKIGVPGSAGQLNPGVVARVVKSDGSLAGYNEPGELRVKSPSLALGYWGNEPATRETFVDGWLCTGDEVIIREDNEIFIVDRLKEIMKVRGFQVAPAELEGCILDHPDVADTCVVPVPDDYSGEVPLAFVVLHVSAATRVEKDPREADKVKASIMKHVTDNKIAYKSLAGGVEFIDVIPKNPSGKLLRRLLRDRARQLKAPGALKAKM
ncbi:hypothetical protein AZE42_04979 [Rhizopogon vesiculosus]|uniref:AMP-dependent synthetase/ligase domain-containing protein n=1 Tax=Rhizopogon vesiculosus TaxID=180088 RepID=A0A1J8QYJ7_9AGAM|nr:hypothetical protein AZE42_04979 [Rhizopogon vesiculosus]